MSCLPKKRCSYQLYPFLQAPDKSIASIELAALSKYTFPSGGEYGQSMVSLEKDATTDLGEFRPWLRVEPRKRRFLNRPKSGVSVFYSLL